MIFTYFKLYYININNDNKYNEICNNNINSFENINIFKKGNKIYKN